ncbi:MAG: flavin reductase family protein [Candidatus Eisenbacteria bacterium]|uniref:Flavin reductase family protein n=1 Tax=Eiseniibacteriota bacterium TaxID=2212470 RepID=A0A933SDY8_UNCEI|nr:flavin reductase family protein [Candidatus Eisenbacteria bacterium]
MRLDPADIALPQMYSFLTSAVVPRPIAFVSTRSASGGFNLAPFSYFIAISSAPPLVGLAVVDRKDDPKDTLRNIRETGEFVINAVDEDLLPAMVQTAGEWPTGVNEFEIAGLTPAPSEKVQAPSVQESPIHLECRLHREIPLGNAFFLVGEIVLARVDERVLTEGRVDAAKLRPVGRLGGEFYMPFRELAKVPRPRISRSSGQPLT